MKSKISTSVFLRFIAIFAISISLSSSCFAQQGQVNLTYKNDNNSLLWEICGNGLKENSYLFGTMHMLCQSDLHISDQFKTALKNSSALYLEAYDENASENNDKSKMYMNDGKTLSDICTKDEYNKIIDFFKNKFDIPSYSIYTFKPMILGVLLTTRLMPCTSLCSMENEITKLAIKDNKPILGLESNEVHNAFTEQIPYSKQVKSLLKTIDSFNVYKGYNDSILFVYNHQKLDMLESVFCNKSFTDTEFTDMILKNRSKAWVDELKEIMNNKSVFIAVGAMHLVGENGLIELLKKQGYTLRALQN